MPDSLDGLLRLIPLAIFSLSPISNVSNLLRLAFLAGQHEQLSAERKTWQQGTNDDLS